MQFLRSTNGSPLDKISKALKESQPSKWWDGIGIWFPNARIVDLTPDLAQEWWEYNTENRKLKWAVVNRYKADMISGRWVFNAEPIIISTKRVIIDGQHRLRAVIESGQTIQVLVIFDMEPSSFATVDSGSKRTSGDVLGILGYDDTIILAAAANMVIRYRKSRFKGDQSSITSIQRVDFVTSHPFMQTYMPSARMMKKICVPSVIVAGMFLTHEKHPELAAEFWDKVVTGKMIDENDPEYILRDRMTSLRFGGKNEETKRSHAHHADSLAFLYCIAVAWNAKVEGRSLSRITIKSDYVQMFPEFK